jgi:Protein of unknown function (DUF1761)
MKVNYIAAVATGFAAFALRLVWYSPLMFGNIWTALRNAPLHALPGWTLVFAPLREIVTALFLAHLFVHVRLGSWSRALAFGVVSWVASGSANAQRTTKQSSPVTRTTSKTSGMDSNNETYL